MPQESLFTSRPTTGLILEVEDQTLTALADATSVTVRAVDTRGDTRFVASCTLVGVQQDLLDTLVQRVTLNHRYGTDADVRKAVQQTMVEARHHSKVHERAD